MITRKLWLGLLAFILVLPAWAVAAPTPEQLLRRIDELTRELENVKQELKKIRDTQQDQVETVSEFEDKVEEITTDGIGRFKVWGDYRFRLDSTRVHQPRYFEGSQVAASMMAGQPPVLEPSRNPDNDTIYTNRVRLNAQVKPTENLIFKARLAAYKLWGMDSDFASAGDGMFPSNLMTNNMTHGVRPSDSRLYVDRAYVNWTNIFDWPIWFSVGRRPTTHTVPKQFREGLDQRDASPFGANIDIPFDGATIGYQYETPVPGRIRFCYGRGFESGFKDIGRDTKLDDVDFYGFVWDIWDDPDEDLLLILQAFKAADIFDFPEGKIFFQDPTAPFGVQKITMTTQSNLGDIYELGAVLQHNYRGIDWFASAGWSITDPDARSQGLMQGYQNDPTADIFEGVSLLTDPFDEDLKTRTGWSVYLGARLPIQRLNSKFGLEYNYGSRYWMPFMVASDDLYMDKLTTRGHVAEAYWIWDLPETPLSKYARAFFRLGYQYFWFDYTGSGNWLGKPIDLDDLADDPLNAQIFTPIDRMDNFYLTFEVFF